MTCVIGLCKGSNVWIGSDTEGITDDGWGGIIPVETPKVWKNGPFIFGSSGSYRAIQIVIHELSTYELLRNDDRKETDPINESFMVRTLVPAIKELLEEYSFSEKKNERSTQRADFLIGVRGKLFLLQDDYAVLELGSRFAAIGSGSYVATGAMEILTQNTKLKPETMIERALTVVCKHVNTVGPPGKVLSSIVKGR